MARYLYSELSSLIQARANCVEKMDKLNPNAVSASVPMHENDYHITQNWRDRHEDLADQLVREHMPSGSGFDSGTKLDWDASHAEKLVFTTAFHHMNENGYYDGWTEHVVTVTPSLAHGFHLRISGRNRNDIKEYIDEQFRYALMRDVEWDIVRTWSTAESIDIVTSWRDHSSIVHHVIRKCEFGPAECLATFDGYQQSERARAFATKTVREMR